jgi:hypothetical protein
MRARLLGMMVVLTVCAASGPLAYGVTNGTQPGGTPRSLEADVRVIASDRFDGRDNNTPGSFLAQAYLIGQLKQFSVGLNASRSGDASFKQPIPLGTNILAVIPGRELPNEYVIVGAHYDEVPTCPTAVPTDHICNGAQDNATGVASVLSIGRELTRGGQRPRRSVILAFWDREEDGLFGSQYYVTHPLRPLARTVAYVNIDELGANLLPSLRLDTFAVGAETGGSQLQSIVNRASGRGPLDMHLFSAVFGSYRSDYANFISVGVPTVFFSDSTGPCYHTAQDDISVVDFSKLGFQAQIGFNVAQQLTEGARVKFSPPTNQLATTYADFVALLQIANRGLHDLGLFTPAQQATLLQFRSDVNAIVAAGPAKFDPNNVIPVLLETQTAIAVISSLPCNGYLNGGNGGNIFETTFKTCNTLHVGYNRFTDGTIVHWTVTENGFGTVDTGQFSAIGGGKLGSKTYHFIDIPLAKALHPEPVQTHMHLTWPGGDNYTATRDPGC